MKIFIFKAISFIFFLLLYLGVNNIVNNAIFHNFKFPLDESKTIIAGDSHTRRSLKPTVLPSAINISQGAEPYVITFWKLKYIFEHYKPKNLILSFSHHNISAFNDMKFWNKKWSSEMFKRSYNIGYFGSLKELKVDKREFYNIYLRQKCLYPHFQHFNFLGGYTNSDSSNLSDLEITIQRHYYYENLELGISDTAIIYIDYIINLCEKNNVRPILIGSPVHEEYFKLIPSAIKKRYNFEKNRLKKHGIMVLDFTQEKYENSFFLNSDHLNEKGASQFTKKIAVLMKSTKE